jgi:hypothetical protein
MSLHAPTKASSATVPASRGPTKVSTTGVADDRASVPKSTIHGPLSGAKDAKPDRAATTLATDPYDLTPYAQELVSRRVMLAPVLVIWQYNVASRKRFTGWLGTREILMSESRLGIDAVLRDVRYCGTYRVGVGPTATGAGSPDDGQHFGQDRSLDMGGTYRTMWGYTTEAAMHHMQRLATNPNGPTTIVQNDFIEFIATIKRYVAEAGDNHFSQDVLIGAAAG